VLPSSRGRIGALLAAALCVLAPSLPVEARHHGARSPAARESGARPGEFDYYLLSLSWSPTYCLTHPGDRDECGNRGYGLILHGLWPQFEHGGYPENCNAPPLDAAARTLGATLFPSENLLRHEWQRHGSCSGLGASDYLRTADRAVAQLVVPAELSAPRHALHFSAAQLAEHLRTANPRLPAGGLRIACSRDALGEIRVCLTRSLQFRDCGAGVGGSCPSGDLRIPAAR
jgi:ribonuclease T2